jgi:DNA-binding PadR family transcriptional regulator
MLHLPELRGRAENFGAEEGKGTPFKVFSGKEATLNRVILLVFLSSKHPLAKYDVYLQIHGMKGLKRKDSKTVYRRIEVLNQEGWIAHRGKRPAKVQGESILYELTLKGKLALRLDEISIEEFLKTASDEQLAKFIDVL